MRKTADNIPLVEDLPVFLATKEGPINGVTTLNDEGNLCYENFVHVIYEVPDIEFGIGTKKQLAKWPISKVYVSKDLAEMQNS